MRMKRICLIWQITTVMFFSCNNASDAQNIAKGKTYVFSALANYALSNADKDHKLLTDGIYTNSHFWTSKTTVGWQYHKRVNIEIDLKQISTIDKITFNTVRGSAGVQFPSNIFVFLSTDKKSYTYVGDAAVDPDNTPGSYETKKFALNKVNKTARYVQLVVIPNGVFIFCDEIEVLAGNNPNNNNLKNQIHISNVNGAVDSLQKVKSNHKKMAYQISRINANFDSSVQKTNLSAHLAAAKLDRLRSLRLKYGNSIIIDKVSPWDVLSLPYQLKNNKDKNFNIVTTINGVQYGAFAITNLTKLAQSFNCRFENAANNISSNQLFIVPFVTSGDKYKEIADPLIYTSGNEKIEPGESVIYFFKITGEKSGQKANNIIIQSKSFIDKLIINVNVLSQPVFNGNYSLSTNNWAYLSYPLINDRQDVAINDLLAHHINTMVVPPNKIPVIGNNDYRVFVSYLSKLKPFQNIFLFMDLTSVDYQNSFKQDAFMSINWKSKFDKWYNGIVQSAKSVGINSSRIFLYPYDEVQAENIKRSADFLRWLKTDHPDVRTFGTLSTKPAVDELMSLLTISQVADIGDLIQRAKTNSSKDFWFYDAKTNAEQLSPYAYYRLMAWKAFFHGNKGIGFWSYADYVNGSTNKTDINNFDGVNATNYSVIYNDTGKGLISSRRWEAFRLGVEDYELLTMYAKQNGLAKAKQLAESVINNSNNLDKADLIRNQILRSLVK